MFIAESDVLNRTFLVGFNWHIFLDWSAGSVIDNFDFLFIKEMWVYFRLECTYFPNVILHTLLILKFIFIVGENLVAGQFQWISYSLFIFSSWLNLIYIVYLWNVNPFVLMMFMYCYCPVTRCMPWYLEPEWTSCVL